MKKLTAIFLFLFQFVFPYNSNGQTISTVSEIYNYEIGDIFHTRESFGIAYFYSYIKFFNFQIMDKYYSANNDSLFYICDVKTHYADTDNPTPVYASYVDTLTVINLDSLINHGDIDTAYFALYYNGRKVNYNLETIGLSVNSMSFIDGCGGPYYSNHGPYGAYDTTHQLQLIYYKKGIEEFGTPFYISINENATINKNITIIPNPASDHITISNPTKATIEIVNTAGQLVKTVANVENEVTIDVVDLPEGLYFILLSKSNVIIGTEKLMIINN
jgi:hypothetical protein